MLSACLMALRNCRRGCKPWHELLAYETTKRVIIKDPAIGLMRFFAIFVVFVYLCAYRIYNEQAYLKLEPVSAIVGTSLKAPDTLPSASQLSYCSESANTAGMTPALSVLPCVSGPDAWVAAPSNGGSELFIGTRVKGYKTDGTTQRAFVVSPELYTVGITFTVQALQFYHYTRSPLYSKSIADLSTRLVDANGVTYTNGVTRLGRFDIIKVGTLLHAAGLDSLEDAHDADGAVTNRYDGLVLLLNLECPMNTEGTVTYCDYKVEHMAKSAAETFVINEVNASATIGVQERRGIKIVVHASGSMGRFDLPTLLLAWVASFALVEVVTLVINWMLNYVLPYKGLYHMLMYDESPNFHDLRAGGYHGKKANRAVERLKEERAKQSGELASPPNSPKGRGAVSPAVMGEDHHQAAASRMMPAGASPGMSPAAMPPAGMMPHLQPGGGPPMAGMMPPQPQQHSPGQAGAMRPGGGGMPPQPGPTGQDRSRSNSPYSQSNPRTPSPNSASQQLGWQQRQAMGTPNSRSPPTQAMYAPPPREAAYRQRAPGAINVDGEAY